MSKLNNTWKNYPNITQLLEREVYERRRETEGMSQYALADKIGVTRNCIQQMEAHQHMPKPYTVYDIIIALGFSEEERNAFAAKYLEAYYKDKALQKEQENMMPDPA